MPHQLLETIGSLWSQPMGWIKNSLWPTSEPKESGPSYLFIPFSEEEDTYELVMSASDWRWNTPEHKKPTIVCYRGERWEALQECPPNSKIYIMGHGMDGELMVGNSTGNEINITSMSFLEMSQIAERLKEKLSPDFQGTIKLYFCAQGEKQSKQRSLFFSNAFLKNRDCKNIRIDYYTKTISNAQSENRGKIAGVVNYNHEDMTMSLSSLSKPKECRKSIYL